jgi:hypothetical protein
MKIALTILAAMIASVVANLVLLFSLRPLVINPAMPFVILSAAPVTIFTIGGVLAALAVYALMRQFLAHPNRPYRPFVVLSGVVLILSFIPDYRIIGNTTEPMFAGANWGCVLVLMLMHIVVAVIVVWTLTTRWGSRS